VRRAPDVSLGEHLLSLASGNVEKGAHLVGGARHRVVLRVVGGAFLCVEIRDESLGQILGDQAAGHGTRLSLRPATRTARVHSA
jgi:hypothetical protein